MLLRRGMEREKPAVCVLPLFSSRKHMNMRLYNGVKGYEHRQDKAAAKPSSRREDALTSVPPLGYFAASSNAAGQL